MLRQLGFDVVTGIDLDKRGMSKTIRTFSKKLDDADVALFFYAGHGLQVNGQNYLAPVNARLKDEADLDFDMVPLNLVLRQMRRTQRVNMVFLDACRDNPLLKELGRSMGATRSASLTRGLARVENRRRHHDFLCHSPRSGGARRHGAELTIYHGIVETYCDPRTGCRQYDDQCAQGRAEILQG